ncbi:MAG: MCM DNA helicase complex subunit mcm6 [Pleopsidium flavum]|nr:MAG: MCM DNA helicase complex subunit mcm6 [Pleopsidium flavum]
MSIISVEKDDVEVDDDEEGGEERVVDGPIRDGSTSRRDGDDDSPMRDEDGHDEHGGAGGVSAGRASQTPGPGRRTKITYDKYMAILNMLVRRVNEDEMTTGEGVEHEELVIWYLEQKEDELNSQVELEAEKELVKKVLKRMVKGSGEKKKKKKKKKKKRRTKS